MKVLGVCLAAMLLCQTMAMSLLMQRPNQKVAHSFLRKIEYINPYDKVAADLCPTCISFTGQAINTLLNIILQGGVIGSCSALCNALAQKTGSQALGEVCTLICDIAGVEEFIKLIEKADLDPIYFCELINLCPINDNGDAKFTSFTITPSSGPQGPREVDFTYMSKNGTGTGEIVLEVETVDGLPIDGSFLHQLAGPGTYPSKVQLKAEPDPDCDPSQGPCEQWLPGNYTLKIAICNGECGSKHPHSQIYDEAQLTFVITEDNRTKQ